MSAIKEWARKAEEALWKQAELSGLLSHSGMKGESREDVLGDLLRSFLPQSMHVGRGQLLDHQGRKSKQVDLVVARGDTIRLPLSQTGSCVHLVESVIAAFEVKSSLDKKALADAFRVAESIYDLGFLVNVPDPRPPDRLARGENLNEDEVQQLKQLDLYPATYCYAYKNRMANDPESFARSLLLAGTETYADPSHMPAVVAVPGLVAIRNDGVLVPSEAYEKPWFAACRCEEHPLYWILAHLLGRITLLLDGGNTLGHSGRFLIESHLEKLPSQDWQFILDPRTEAEK